MSSTFDLLFETETETKMKTAPGELTVLVHDAFKVKNFIKDGFKKVCEARPSYGNWFYRDINLELMYADHRSWVYFITIYSEKLGCEFIVKVGETGNPLGIRIISSDQPKKGTDSRFGRLRSNDGTDSYLRRVLNPYIENGCTVNLWAKKCEITERVETIMGKPTVIKQTIHKDLEMVYLDFFRRQTGCIPQFNKARK